MDINVLQAKRCVFYGVSDALVVSLLSNILMSHIFHTLKKYIFIILLKVQNHEIGIRRRLSFI